jgi:hypothetical protein
MDLDTAFYRFGMKLLSLYGIKEITLITLKDI